MLADKPFAKFLQSLETFVFVDNNLNEKLFSSLESPVIFDDRFKITSVPFLFLLLMY